MRDLIKYFVEICADCLPIREPIYEFGSLQVPGQEGYADLRVFFPDKKYIGADMRPGTGVDVILNLHTIDLPSKSVGSVLCLDTLEHVEYPRRALAEIHRILDDDGILILSSVMDFPIHDYPQDYWRFTPEGFRSLLNDFHSSVISFAGESFPHTVIGIGFKGIISETIVKTFEEKLLEWQNFEIPRETPQDLPEDIIPQDLPELVYEHPRVNETFNSNKLKEFVKLFLPPICLRFYDQIKKI